MIGRIRVVVVVFNSFSLFSFNVITGPPHFTRARSGSQLYFILSILFCTTVHSINEHL